MAVDTMGLKPFSDQNLIPKVEVNCIILYLSILYDTCASIENNIFIDDHPPSWLHDLLFRGGHAWC